MPREVHQRIYGPFTRNCELALEANPDIAEVNYRANITNFAQNNPTNWGDGQLEEGVTYILSESVNYFLTITAEFLVQEEVTLTLVFTGAHGEATEVITFQPESANETHLVSIDIIVEP